MANTTIDANGVIVDLRDRNDLITTIDDMVEDYSSKLKSGRIKTNKGKRTEMATISFFASISHYLKGGIE